MAIEMGDKYINTRPLRQYNAKVAVCILAAGIAKRLEPISEVIAKPAFPLGGQIPIAELWVRKFVDAGINKMVMNLHRVPESIRGYFGNGRRFLAEITYVYEQIPSGTLGGVIKMVRALQAEGYYPERVFVPSGDIVSKIGAEHLEVMLNEHSKRGAAITLMLAPVPWERRGDFGTAILEGVPAGKEVTAGTYARILDFVEKDPNSPSNVNNASNYLIETDFLLQLEPYLSEAKVSVKEPCYDFGKHVFMGMKGKVAHLEFLTRWKNDIYGYEPGTFWFDVGNKRDYLEVNKAVLNNEIQLDLSYTRYPWGWMGDNVEVDFDKVIINAPVIIGNNCTIFPAAEIGPNVVLGDGWTCHKGARIKDAVLWQYYNYDAADLNTRMDRVREVREGVVVDTAIIVGGIITSDIKEKTVDLLSDGELNISSIDWVPAGPRA
ncbi:MAG: NDP-sugar synthase [Acidobacteriota bacterium]